MYFEAEAIKMGVGLMKWVWSKIFHTQVLQPTILRILDPSLHARSHHTLCCVALVFHLEIRMPLQNYHSPAKKAHRWCTIPRAQTREWTDI